MSIYKILGLLCSVMKRNVAYLDGLSVHAAFLFSLSVAVDRFVFREISIQLPVIQKCNQFKIFTMYTALLRNKGTDRSEHKLKVEKEISQQSNESQILILLIFLIIIIRNSKLLILLLLLLLLSSTSFT